MAQVINTNIASLTAQRNLATSQKDAATAMQRLSSGLRINSAKDDAAGLAIASRLTSQINGVNQAVRNANDGLSVAQVAEGALAETTDILQRMRTLAVQAANASNSADDRASTQTEIAQLAAEVDRIANATKFGNNALLNGTYLNQSFQVGADVGETVRFSINSAQSADLGSLNTLDFTTANFSTGAVSTAATTANNESYIEAQTLTFQVGPAGDLTSYTVAVADNATAADIASSITAGVAEVSATSQTVVRLTDGTSSVFAASDTVNLDINGVSLTGIDFSSFANFVTAAEAAIEAESSLNNLTVNSVNGGADLEIIDASGANITIELTGHNDALTVDGVVDISVDAYDDTFANSGSVISSTNSGTLGFTATAISGEDVTGQAVTVSGNVNLFAQDDSLQYTIQSSVDISATGGIAENSAAQTGTVTAVANATIDGMDVSTVAGAEQAIQIIDAALSTINDQRATLGAVQSRFDSVVSNLMNVAENASAARSRIMDADFAAETAQLAKTQILQQAGISVLAQANAQPQNVLALLQ